MTNRSGDLEPTTGLSRYELAALAAGYVNWEDWAEYLLEEALQAREYYDPDFDRQAYLARIRENW